MHIQLKCMCVNLYVHTSAHFPATLIEVLEVGNGCLSRFSTSAATLGRVRSCFWAQRGSSLMLNRKSGSSLETSATEERASYQHSFHIRLWYFRQLCLQHVQVHAYSPVVVVAGETVLELVTVDWTLYVSLLTTDCGGSGQLGGGLPSSTKRSYIPWDRSTDKRHTNMHLRVNTGDRTQ